MECNPGHTPHEQEADRLIGQKAAEKVGKGWALTTFLREAGGSTGSLSNSTQDMQSALRS